MVLASGDSYGQIVIWDVATSNALHVLSEGMKPIQGNLSIYIFVKTFFSTFGNFRHDVDSPI